MNIVSSVFANGSRAQYNVSFMFNETDNTFFRTYSYEVDSPTSTEVVSVKDMLDEIPELCIQEVYLEIEKVEYQKMLDRANW
jgi:hypothetical protein